MQETGGNASTDFLVTFFISDFAVTKKLSDVIKNKESKLFRGYARASETVCPASLY